MSEIVNLLDPFRIFFLETQLFKIQDVVVTPNHLVVALVVVVLSTVISRLVRSVMQRGVLRRMRLDPGVEFTLLRMVHFVIVAIGVYIGLATISIPMGAILGLFAVLGVGIGFGLQNLASNFVSGVILLFERPVKVGDFIEVDEIIGKVLRINLRTTTVMSFDNIAIIVPNSKLLENNVTNFSHGDLKVKLHVPIGVAYGSDVPKVTEILMEIAAAHPDVLEDPEPAVWFMEFGDSSLNLELLCWLPRPEMRYMVRDVINREIDRRFREENVTIPFPQRDLHLKSVEQGVKLGG